MSFYGECHGMDWGANITGAPIGNFGNLVEHFDGTVETIQAGEAFTVGAYEWAYLATYADEIVYSWVIETGPGSNGTLELADGYDTTWSYSAAACTNDLGSHAVAGEQRLVVPASVTHDQYWWQGEWATNDGEATLLVTCTSGEVEIQQIKMQLWPPGGPQGAWALADGSVVTSTGAAYKMGSGFSGEAGGTVFQYPGPQAAADDGLELARVNLGQVYDGSEIILIGRGSGQLISAIGLHAEGRPWVIGSELGPGYTGVGLISEDVGLLVAEVDDVDPSAPAGAGVDPREILGDAMSIVRNLSQDGPPQGVFAGWVGSMVGYAGEGTDPNTATGAVHFVTLAGDPRNGPPQLIGGTFHYFASRFYFAGGAGTAIPTDAYSGVPIPVTGGQYVMVTTTTEGRFGGTPPLISYSGGEILLAGNGYHVDMGSEPLRFQTSFGPFLYFDPSLPWDEHVGLTSFAPPGLFLTPDPNLDGELQGTAVQFATT